LLVFFVIFTVVLCATTIYDVQYTTVPGADGTYPSLLVDQDVTVTGIVTGGGFVHGATMFFMTDPEGGAWHGVYVYDLDTGPVTGDEVEVSATVSEYYGLTELGYCTITILSSGNPIPDPVLISTAQLATEEAYEGVFVELNNVVVTSAQNAYGEWYVTDASATPGQMDDGFFYLDSVTPPIVINVGDTWAVLRGIVNYSYDEFELNPRTPDDMIAVVSSPHNIVTSQSEFYGCYPNPFNPETTAYLYLVEDTQLRLNVYNLKGEKVRTLVENDLSAGEHHITWNGKDDQNKNVSSGIYFLCADSKDSDFTSVKKIILMK